MSLNVLFTASATAVGGRNGHAETKDKLLSVNLSIPKEMGGPGSPGAVTPEHLFAAGYAACFGSAIEFVAKQQKKPLKTVSVTADVGIGKLDTGGFGLTATLNAHLEGVSPEEAQALVSEADKVCPYSNAVRGNVEVKLGVN